MAPRAAAHGRAVTQIADLRARRLAAEPVADHAAAVAWCWAHPTAARPGGAANLAAQRRGGAAMADRAARHPRAPIAVGTHGHRLARILQR